MYVIYTYTTTLHMVVHLSGCSTVVRNLRKTKHISLLVHTNNSFIHSYIPYQTKYMCTCRVTSRGANTKKYAYAVTLIWNRPHWYCYLSFFVIVVHYVSLHIPGKVWYHKKEVTASASQLCNTYLYFPFLLMQIRASPVQVFLGKVYYVLLLLISLTVYPEVCTCVHNVYNV